MDSENTQKILKNAKKNNVPTFLDVAWDPTGKWNAGNIFEHLDFFLPNEDEIMQIARTNSLQRGIERLHKMGQRSLIIKRGSKGCYVAKEGKKPVRINAPKVKVVDTTGAGDAFNAGFIYSFLNTEDLLASAEFAVYTASKTVTGIGGSGNAPSADEVKRFIRAEGGGVYFK
jgi:sugar/nucleoside kinase (ribokinase family)